MGGFHRRGRQRLVRQRSSFRRCYVICRLRRAHRTADTAVVHALLHVRHGVRVGRCESADAEPEVAAPRDGPGSASAASVIRDRLFETHVCRWRGIRAIGSGLSVGVAEIYTAAIALWRLMACQSSVAVARRSIAATSSEKPIGQDFGNKQKTSGVAGEGSRPDLATPLPGTDGVDFDRLQCCLLLLRSYSATGRHYQEYTPLLAGADLAWLTLRPRNAPRGYTLEEVCRSRLIMTSGLRAIVEKQIHPLGRTLGSISEVDSVEAIRRILLRGRGMTLMWCRRSARTLSRRSSLMPPPPPAGDGYRDRGPLAGAGGGSCEP